MIYYNIFLFQCACIYFYNEFLRYKSFAYVILYVVLRDHNVLLSRHLTVCNRSIRWVPRGVFHTGGLVSEGVCSYCLVDRPSGHMFVWAIPISGFVGRLSLYIPFPSQL